MPSSRPRKPAVLIPCLLAAIAAGVVAVVAVAAVVVFRWLPTPGGESVTYPTMRITGSYPGASVQVVERTITVPLEVQLSGMEGLDFIESISRDDGVTIALYFHPGTDVDLALVLAQNRIAMALPILPDVVKHRGVNAFKGGPLPALWLIVESPDQSRDQVYLHNLARDVLVPELKTTPGAAEASVAGAVLRPAIALDPQKLAAHNLTLVEVLNALRLDPNFPGEGRLADQVPDVVVRADGDGQPVRLRDVAGVEMALSGRPDRSRWHGRPATVVAVEGDAARLLEAVRDRLPGLRQRMPAGTDLHLLPGPAVPGAEALLVEGRLPDAASERRVHDAIDRVAAALERLPDPRAEHPVPAVVELPADAPASFRLYVALCPAVERALSHEDVNTRARQVVAEIPEMMGRVTSPSALLRPPRRRAPVVLLVSGPGVEESIRLADGVRNRLAQSGAVADVWSDNPRLAPQVSVHVDREKARQLGVSTEEAMEALQVYLGSADVRGVGVVVHGEIPKWRGPVEDRRGVLEAIKVRNHRGEAVPLSAVARVSDVAGPTYSRRINGKRTLLFTADPPPGVTAAEARRRCHEAAARELPAGYTAECP